MSGYTKLFSSILASTIWKQSNPTRIVWITMLAMADKDGVVEASVPGLADMARVSIDDAVEALKNLESPDEWSRTKEHEGRRIEPIDGGWIILNHAKYRNKINADERREYLRIKQRESRARLSTTVNNCQSRSTLSTQAEAEAEAEAKKKDVGQIDDPKRSAEASPASRVRKKPEEPLEDWLKWLSDQPAYQGIPLLVEWSKMEVWCKQHRKQATRKRFINWLNKIERQESLKLMPDQWSPTKTQTIFNSIFNRSPEDKWTSGEIEAYKAIQPISTEQMEAILRYYRSSDPEVKKWRPVTLVSLLWNWNKSLDKARLVPEYPSV